MSDETIAATVETGLALFDPVKAMIKRAREQNALLTFDYESPSGNAAARSHCAKLRRVNGEIERAHKQAKAEALEVCQKIDAYKRELLDDVAAMLNIHVPRLKEIEEREARAKAEAEAKAQAAREAEAQRQAAELLRQREELAAREAAVRQAEAAQRQREREAEIAAQAEARAKAAAEAALLAEQRRAAAELEAERRRAAEAVAAERQRAADEKARVDAAARAEAERARQEEVRKANEERARLAAEEAKRQNAAHRQAVEDAAFEALAAFTPDSATAGRVLEAIKAGGVPGVTLNY